MTTRFPGLALLPPLPDGEAVSDDPNIGGVGRIILRVFLQNRLAIMGVVIIVLMTVFCFIGPLIYHTNQITTNIANADQAPSGSHLLGTDPVGYDILGRLMVGGQSSLIVGFAVALIGTLVGTLWGAVAGYIGGPIDAIMMRIVDTFLAIPGLVLLLILSTIFRPTVGLLIGILSFLSWLVPARLVRAEALSLRTREYVDAVKVMGGGRRRVVFRHIIPNTIGTIVVNATFQVADAILVVATLSFFGLGLPPPAATWGGILSDGLNYIYDGYWWLVYPAGVAIVLTVVAINFIGDSLRDALDVRLQER
jgi:peptide/nickel transport system permease protein